MYLPHFKEDRANCIESAIAQGVREIFLPNIDSSTIGDLHELVDQFPNTCYPMMGLHPCSVKSDYKDELQVIERHLLDENYFAVGEIGIDLHWDTSHITEQIEAFTFQINLAKKLGLPIVVHARKSFSEIFNVIDELNDDKLCGIFHCFTGTLEEANKILNYGGFKLGIGGVVTYKNAGLAETLKDIDIQNIVLETDAPYLTPVPHRGKRNETSYVYFVAEKLAEIYDMSIEKVGDITTANAHEIFKF